MRGSVSWMRRWLGGLIVAIGFGLCGSPSSAQTVCASPCTLTAGQSYTLQADHDGSNTSGYRIYLDGVKVGNDVPVSALVLANGAITFVNMIAPAAGSHTIQIGAYNTTGESKSTALAFTTVVPPPAPPTNLRIIITATMAADGTLQFKVTSVESGGQ